MQRDTKWLIRNNLPLAYQSKRTTQDVLPACIRAQTCGSIGIGVVRPFRRFTKLP
jgi:hypothetical protein